MRSRLVIILAAGIMVIFTVAAIAAFTLIPENNPAFDVAVRFANAAGSGDDATAAALLTPPLQTYVAENCPDASVSACIRAYTPPAWGDLLRAVYRRSRPQGEDVWHVDVIATYAEDVGYSGVCIYYRLEQQPDGRWLIGEWAGYEHCAESTTRLMETNTDAPNRAP